MIQAKMQIQQDRIESVLHSILPKEGGEFSPLHQAIRYSTLEGGKRIRPLLVYATGEAFMPIH